MVAHCFSGSLSVSVPVTVRSLYGAIFPYTRCWYFCLFSLQYYSVADKQGPSLPYGRDTTGLLLAFGV